MSRCKVGALVDRAPELGAWRLQRVLDAPEVAAVRIAEVLTRNGHPVGQVTVRDHRAGRCVCARTA